MHGNVGEMWQSFCALISTLLIDRTGVGTILLILKLCADGFEVRIVCDGCCIHVMGAIVFDYTLTVGMGDWQ